MTERNKFMRRLEEARRQGLVDMRLSFHPTRPMATEEIFAALNEVEDAIEAGRCVRHDAWIGNQPATCR